MKLFSIFIVIVMTIISISSCENQKEEETFPDKQNSDLKVKSVYPNPIRQDAKLIFGISESTKIDISLMEQTGRKVKDFATKELFQKGEHEFSLNFTGVKSGDYMLLIITEDGNKEAVKILKE